MRYLLVTVFVTSMTSLSKYMDEWKDLSQVKQQRIAQVCVFSTRLESPYLHARNPHGVNICNTCKYKTDLCNSVKAEKVIINKHVAWCKLI